MSFSHPPLFGQKRQGKEYLMICVVYFKASKFHFNFGGHISTALGEEAEHLNSSPQESEKCQMPNWFTFFLSCVVFGTVWFALLFFFLLSSFETFVCLAWIKKASSNKKSDWFENSLFMSVDLTVQFSRVKWIWSVFGYRCHLQRTSSLRKVSPRLISINTCKTI